MSALALMFDESEHDVIEINGGDKASIFRVFSRSTKSIYDQPISPITRWHGPEI